MTVYLSQDSDYHDLLRTKLGDLQGADTLIHELAQNAHDSYQDAARTRRATRISFDIRDEGLLVKNDGVFSCCGDVKAAECLWRVDDPEHERCDFHRFRKVAGGDKAREDNVFGAFGIGFISVYQITDRPEFRSSGLHWILDPAQETNQRIRSEPDDLRCAGTEFWLPWAPTSGSALGVILRRPPVKPAEHIRSLVERGPSLAESAIMFLENIETIELLRNGTRLALVTKTEDSNELVIDTNGSTQSWLLLNSEFESYKRDADVHLNGLLSKRSAAAIVAIPERPETIRGLLFCGLPTRQASQLPFHVNAHFFPSSDRKRIDTEGESFEVDWNIAALEAAASAVADNLELIGRTLGASALWSLLSGVYAQNKRSELQQLFWSKVMANSKAARVVLSSRHEWHRPDDVVFLVRPEEDRNIKALEALGLNVASPSLRSHQSTLRALGVKWLGASEIVHALEAVVPREARLEAASAPGVLADSELRTQFADELEQRFQDEATERITAVRERLRGLPICLTLSGHLASPKSLIAAPSESETLALQQIGTSQIMADSAANCGTAIRRLVPDHYVLMSARYLVKLVEVSDFSEYGESLRRFFTWLRDSHMSEVRDSDELRILLIEAPIWPAHSSLHPLVDLAIPGGFTDALGLAQTLDTEFSPGLADLASSLGCRQLSVIDYAVNHVPSAFSEETLALEEIEALLASLAACLPELMSSNAAKSALSGLPLVPCGDGETRRPTEVMFDSAEARNVLGDDVPFCQRFTGPKRALLEWLGVSSVIGAASVIARIKSLAAGPLTPASRTSAQRALTALARVNTMQPVSPETLAPLCSLAWLPAVGEGVWYRPSALLTAFQRETLFGNHGLQLDLPRKSQQEASALLSDLGLRQSPSLKESIDYLEELLETGSEPSLELFKFLDRSDIPTTEVKRLSTLPLFRGADGRRFESDRAFRSPHPFGRWAVTLQGEWGALSSLLTALNVHHTATAADAARILGYIEYERGEFQEALDSETLNVVKTCWSMIGDCSDAELNSVLPELEGRRCAPDGRGALVPPDHLFFNDQPSTASYVAPVLGPALIARAGDSWRGLARAGVTDISRAVSLEVQSVDGDLDTSAELQNRLDERRDALLRAMAQDDRLRDPAEVLDSWQGLRCVTAKRVSVRLLMKRPPLDVAVDCIADALLDRSSSILYVIGAEQYPAAAIARELLTGAGVEASHLPLLVTAIEQVLAAADMSAAHSALDVRGFARFEQTGGLPTFEESTLPAAASQVEEASASAPQHEAHEAASVQQPAGRDAWPDPSRDDYSPRKPRRSEERLRSYVVLEHDDLKPDTSAPSNQRRLEIDAAGTERVMAYEASRGRTPEKMAHLNKGYDIVSEDSMGRVRYIEVKSAVDLWGAGGVGITPAQHDYARRNPDEWWLYVVEAAESETNWAIYCINNFVDRTYRYMFDDGWRVAAKEKHGHWKSNESSIKRPVE